MFLFFQLSEKNFPPNIFNPWLAESMDVEPATADLMNMENQLYMQCTSTISPPNASIISFGDCFSYKKLKNLHADFFESLSSRNKYLIIYEEMK